METVLNEVTTIDGEPLVGTPHNLKCWLTPFEAIWSGKKTFELRKNDRGFQVGDTLVIREWDPSVRQYTGRMVVGLVEYMIEDCANWGLAPDHCIMAFTQYGRVS